MQCYTLAAALFRFCDFGRQRDPRAVCQCRSHSPQKIVICKQAGLNCSHKPLSMTIIQNYDMMSKYLQRNRIHSNLLKIKVH